MRYFNKEPNRPNVVVGLSGDQSWFPPWVEGRNALQVTSEPRDTDRRFPGGTSVW